MLWNNLLLNKTEEKQRNLSERCIVVISWISMMSDLSNNFNVNHPAQSDKFHQLYRFREYRFISTMQILTNQTIDNHCMLELVFETKAEHTICIS